MQQPHLPKGSREVLDIVPQDVPRVFQALVSARALSPLVRDIHRDLASPSAGLRSQARRALRHLGFPE